MDWWDWFVRKGRAGDVVYGRSYWSTARAGRTMSFEANCRRSGWTGLSD